MTNRWSQPQAGLAASQSRIVERVSRHSGRIRSRRPLPVTRTLSRSGWVRSGDPDGDQFRDPEAGGVGQVQHRPIPPATGGCRIGGIEQGPDFRALQMGDGPRVMPLHRHGVHLPGEVETGRQAVFEVVKEGLDRRQPDIARADGVAAIGFQMVEEAEQEIGGEMLDRDRARPDSETPGGEAQQQHEAVGVACDRVPAGIAPARQMFAQERAEMGCEVGHGRAPRCMSSASLAMARIRTGVACRYQ